MKPSAMDDLEYRKALQLRFKAREIVNRLPVHLDTSADMEEAIKIIEDLIVEVRDEPRCDP